MEQDYDLLPSASAQIPVDDFTGFGGPDEFAEFDEFDESDIDI